LRSSLSVCILTSSDLAQTLTVYLSDVLAADASFRYKVNQFDTNADFLLFIQTNHHIDCLILQEHSQLQDLLNQLQQQALFFPTVIFQTSEPTATVSGEDLLIANSHFSYHGAVLYFLPRSLNQIGLWIDQAISKFIQLTPSSASLSSNRSTTSNEALLTEKSLMAQQLRLAQKLKERLGYLGVYYKRNPQNFLRHMAQAQREELLRQLKADYREIILGYFLDSANLNGKIDNFINTTFFADVPVYQIVEIHMELMDEFSKQLKLEGRSDEILLDYRLTLIDTISHLCEMYRRSIPRES
jgi:circadian clock protein KaiA